MEKVKVVRRAKIEGGEVVLSFYLSVGEVEEPIPTLPVFGKVDIYDFSKIREALQEVAGVPVTNDRLQSVVDEVSLLPEEDEGVSIGCPRYNQITITTSYKEVVKRYTEYVVYFYSELLKKVRNDDFRNWLREEMEFRI